ncbi:hypothetical protein BIY22_16950 [Vibrio panuliri]|uniref:DUF2057 domain-containing protein n=1 Tax=Vibrio panuliri TaxID=1381081 RepID=A0A1Q9HMK1_9VIBR|nr:hypothetical protein [Vibrio panuliri]OLQ91944.1 hypothetical protein BIY22_16950 [Vibrio panuliri]
MKSLLSVSLPFLIVGCSTLSPDDAFNDVVYDVKQKQNYSLVTGKELKPITVEQRQGQLVKATVALNYVVPQGSQSLPPSYLSMEMAYLKSYDEYKYALINGTEIVELEAYAPTSETCSDICMKSQYFYIPLDEAIFKQQPISDINFDVMASKNKGFSFTIPGGYVDAVVEQGSKVTTAAPQPVKQEVVVAAAPVKREIDSSLYWYEKVPAENSDEVLQWAVKNRSNANLVPLESSLKEVEMFSYWFSQSSISDRKAILIELLK